MIYMPAELIKKKKKGQHHTEEELSFLISEFTKGNIPEYQMSAWLMAVCFQGMSDKETANFTRSMRDSGKVLDFSELNRPVVDKHSTGGVGDKTSLVVGPIAAAAGVPVASIAGRGLGHSGGTLDKLESIPGFSVQFTLNEFKNLVTKHGLALVGQTDDVCPADKKLYALRDVTGTVESLPLICASIMSKKLAEGLSGLVLDVKFGSGAFMKSFEDAKKLAVQLKSIGEHNGLKVVTLLTNMNQPLGQAIGNALEVEECLNIMEGHKRPSFEDTRELCLELASWMILLGKKAKDISQARKIAEEMLVSGQALKQFKQMCYRQGAKQLRPLARAKIIEDFVAEESGFMFSIDTEAIGIASVLLGAGRLSTDDQIDMPAGIEYMKKIGEPVGTGDCLLKLHTNSQEKLLATKNKLKGAIKISSSIPPTQKLVAEILS